MREERQHAKRVTALAVTMIAAAGFMSGCNLDSSGGTGGAVSNAAIAPADSAARVSISWMPPQTNVNGSVLTDLAGYHIHFGTRSTALTRRIDVPNPGVSDYVIEDLRANTTYYFAVSSYNSAGVESNYSSIVSVTTS